MTAIYVPQPLRSCDCRICAETRIARRRKTVKMIINATLGALVVWGLILMILVATP